MTSQKPPPVQSPHDALFRETFSKTERATELLKCSVPSELAAVIDWGSLELEPGSFVDEELKWRHTDLLFRAKLSNEPLFMFLLMEHQSSDDRMMAFRMLRYVVRILERYLEDNPQAKTLPAVLPLVVSHSEHPWSSPTEMLELFKLDGGVEGGEGNGSLMAKMAPYLPSMSYLLDDLSAQTAAQLNERALDPESKLTVLALRHARVKFFAEYLKGWAGLVQALQSSDDGRAKVTKLFRYILSVGEDAPEQLQDVLHNHIGSAASEVIMSTAERLREEGWDRGHEVGRQEGWRKGQQVGRQEGRQEALAGAVLTQLNFNFTTQTTSLPDGTSEKIAQASQEELSTWLERILTAKSLEDVFRS